MVFLISGSANTVIMNQPELSFKTFRPVSPQLPEPQTSNSVQGSGVSETATVFVVTINHDGGRVGFSMFGGRDEGCPTFVNNIVNGTPAEKAGLCIGDEIQEINGISVENSTHSEIVRLIHQCLKNKRLQLKVKRQSNNVVDGVIDGTDSCVRAPKLINGKLNARYFNGTDTKNSVITSEGGSRNGRITDAYMVSVDREQKQNLKRNIQQGFPGIRTFDMENLSKHSPSLSPPNSTFSTESSTVSTTQLSAGMVSKSGTFDSFPHYPPPPPPLPTNGIVRNGSSEPIMAETSFISPYQQPFENHHASNRHYAPDEDVRITISNSKPSEQILTPANLPSTHVRPPLTEHHGAHHHVNASHVIVSSTDALPALSNELNVDKLREYEQRIRKRRESEESQHVREDEFKRLGSIRTSQKLQKLTKQTSGPQPPSSFPDTGIANPAYVMTPSPNGQEPVGNFPGVHLGESGEYEKSLRKVFGEQTWLRCLLEPTQCDDWVSFEDARDVWTSRQPSDIVSEKSLPTFAQVTGCLSQSSSSLAVELMDLLSQPQFKPLLYAHDKIAQSCQKNVPKVPSEICGLKETSFGPSKVTQDLRIVHLMKDGDSPIGATVRNDHDAIFVSRVIKGGVAEKSGVIREGDEILEINSIDIRGKTVGEVCELMFAMTGKISFIIIPAPIEGSPDKDSPSIKHMRALFDYEPEDDVYIPCRELGLHFERGEILHVISTNDENWWQAYRDGEDNPLAGLIPSASFQKRLQDFEYQQGFGKDAEAGQDVAFLFCGSKNNRKKKNQIETAASAGDMLAYEEVSLYIPRTGRKRPIVLIGPANIGCLELRQKLLQSETRKFSGVVPYTSRPKKPGEVDGVHYWFVSKSQFQHDVNLGKFVEWGEYQKYCYGTTFEAVQAVINRGEICVLTLRPQSLSKMRNAKLMPYVVFISPPRIEWLRVNHQKLNGGNKLKEEDLRLIIQEAELMYQSFGHLFDKTIVNYDIDRTFQDLRTTVHKLETEPQWVPSWWLDDKISGLKA